MHQFSKKRGLCGNVAAMYPSDVEVEVVNEMSRQFAQIKNVEDSRYPLTGRQEYAMRHTESTQYLCRKRLAWAREHAYSPAPTQSKELTEFYMAWYLWAVEENAGYAIYSPDAQGKLTGRRCTKEEYEAELKRLASLRTATVGTAIQLHQLDS